MRRPRKALWWVALCISLLWVGGLVLWRWDAEAVLDAASSVQALRRSLLVSHGLLAWLLCLLAGAVLWPHVRHQLHHLVRHRSHHSSEHPSHHPSHQAMPDRLRWSVQGVQSWLGLGSAVLLAALALSGVGLLYAPGPWHDWLDGLHHWSGLVLVLPLLPHLFRWAGRAAPGRSRSECRRVC